MRNPSRLAKECSSPEDNKGYSFIIKKKKKKKSGEGIRPLLPHFGVDGQTFIISSSFDSI